MKKSLSTLATLLAAAAMGVMSTPVAQARPKAPARPKRKARVHRLQPITNSPEIIKHNEMIEMKRIMKQASKAQRRQV